MADITMIAGMVTTLSIMLLQLAIHMQWHATRYLSHYHIQHAKNAVSGLTALPISSNLSKKYETESPYSNNIAYT